MKMTVGVSGFVPKKLTFISDKVPRIPKGSQVTRYTIEMVDSNLFRLFSRSFLFRIASAVIKTRF